MKITTFNKGVLRQLRTDLDTALEAVAKEYGIQLNLGNIRFDIQSFRVTLSAAIVSTAPAPTNEDGEVDLLTVSFGDTLPANLQGRKFVAGGTTYTLIGVSSRRRKYPFSGEGPQGGKYKFSLEQVRAGLI